MLDKIMSDPMKIWGLMVFLHTLGFILFPASAISWIINCTLVYPMVSYGAANDAIFVLWRQLLDKLGF
jgi:hypothetical protein